MKIEIITLGDHMPTWVNQAVTEYQKRLPPNFSVQFIEIPLLKRHSVNLLPKILVSEKELILKKIPKNYFIVALTAEGQKFSSEKLASRLQKIREIHHDLCFIIGGPEGLHEEVLQKAHEKWSLSELTFAHPIVRIVLMEQLYRVSSIWSGHPYHK